MSRRLALRSGRILVVLGLFGLGGAAWVALGGGATADEPAPAADGIEGRARALTAFAAKNPGKAHEGQAVFKRLGCVGCHRWPGAGGGFGPDLGCVARKYDRETLSRKILSPAKGSPMPANFAARMDGPDFANLMAYLERECPKKSARANP